MKQFFAVLMILVLLISICGCSKTSVSNNADVTLSFVYGDDNIHVTLEDDEAEKVIDILNGNDYNPFSSGVPSCGFDKNIPSKSPGELSQLLVILAILCKILAI